MWTTKGAKSREKHESGRCFRAFRELSWHSWSRSCSPDETSPPSMQELDGHLNRSDYLLKDVSEHELAEAVRAVVTAPRPPSAPAGGG